MKIANSIWAQENLGRVAVPAATRIREDYLQWRRNESDTGILRGFIAGAPIERTIWEFLELKNATPMEIRAFAEQYGVLGIRSDGLPGVAPESGAVNALPEQRIEDDDGYWYVEHLALWRIYSVGLQSVLAAAIEIRDHDDPDWTTFKARWELEAFTWESFELPRTLPDEKQISGIYRIWITALSPGMLIDNLQRVEPQYQRQWISWSLSTSWLRYGNARPQLRWTEEDSSMRMELSTEWGNLWPANSLFSIIVFQLTNLLSGEEFERLNGCSVCGRIFVAKKKPGPKTRPYCEEHKIEIDRERKRRWARKKAAEHKAKVII